MENQIYRRKLLGRGLLNWLKSEFMGIFVFVFFWAVSKAMGMVANVMFGAVGVLTAVCVMADFGLKQGETMKNKVNLHGAKPCRNFGLKIGLIAMLPSYLSLIVLVLSKAGIVGNFLPAYKLLNSCFFPIIDIVAHTANVAEMSISSFGLFAVLPLFFPFSAWLSFKWGYDQVDLKTKVMYKSK